MNSITLTSDEKDLCKVLSFDEQIALAIKNHTNSPIERLSGFGDDGDPLEAPDNGLSSGCNEENSYEFIDSHRDEFFEKGYLLFLFEDDDEEKHLGLLKSKDDFDVIRYRKTNGVNFELPTKRIIDRLQSWRAKHDFFIMGVGLDWIMAGFNKAPQDIKTFTKELVAFSPDVLDQEEGDVSDLENQIREAEGFFLWWD